jgi:sugar phosphate isomerase/epimerase
MLLNRYRWFALLGALVVAATACLPTVSAAEADGELKLDNPFFALINGVADEEHNTPEKMAAMLAEIGYDGIGPSGVNGIPEMIEAMEAEGLKVHAQYVGAFVDGGEKPFDPKLPEAIAAMKGHDTHVWLWLRSKKHRPSTEGGDEEAVKVVGQIADMAEAAGVKVALYPHVGFYVATIDDAVRVAKKVDRENVGVSFNLCHWLKAQGPEGLEAKLRLARPHLFIVQVNGADNEGGWDRLIQPLGEGEFDVYHLLKTVKQMGFDGPVGLQCYAVKGDKKENLRRSMQAWKSYQKRMASE